MSTPPSQPDDPTQRQQGALADEGLSAGAEAEETNPPPDPADQPDQRADPEPMEPPG